ncbi:YceH family protein [Ideonella azotifigens]|uniref:YceH family protein n=1 Tax=Ideonella azotifigens TaxID=513160 RepID=A0ABN1JUA7_9BURK|nr:YceH family protein [Ideonella azotifigens]MCD2341100.1 YceH family protein [Ideonella azotifigens]
MSEEEGQAAPTAEVSAAVPVMTTLQARVLAVLVEKQHTVPDSYPLSLNALQSGCNQKTARAPVMEVSERDLLEALDELKRKHLISEVSGSRVVRFDHNMPRGLGVPSQSAALLATLMLRGPQTAAELRLNSERLHRFADVSSVDAFLDELATKQPARVRKLARSPGEREARWAHLLCGEPPASLAGASGAATGGSGGQTGPSWSDWEALQAEVVRQGSELAELKRVMAELREALGH